jgi:hypothetical protein
MGEEVVTSHAATDIRGSIIYVEFETFIEEFYSLPRFPSFTSNFIH